MRLFRVLPYLSDAAEDEPGGVFFRPAGGKSRADAPDGSYRCLYAAASAEAAIAEAFGRFDTWDRALFEADPATPLLPGSRFALASYELPDDVALRNLDDARTLLDEGLRPSQVVTRNRDVTQGWALRIHARGGFAGVSWWSYYDANWQSIAIWESASLRLAEPPRAISVTDAAVESAAATIVRRIVR